MPRPTAATASSFGQPRRPMACAVVLGLTSIAFGFALAMALGLIH